MHRQYFNLKQIIEKKTSINKDLYLVFVDLTKAYDTVPIIKSWIVLEEIQINSGIIEPNYLVKTRSS